MDLEEIQDRIALLHGRNRNLIQEIKEDPKWMEDKCKANIVDRLEDVSEELYQASLLRGK